MKLDPYQEPQSVRWRRKVQPSTQKKGTADGKRRWTEEKMWRMKLWEDFGSLYESGLKLGSWWRKSSLWERAANPWVTAPGPGEREQGLGS